MKKITVVREYLLLFNFSCIHMVSSRVQVHDSIFLYVLVFYKIFKVFIVYTWKYHDVVKIKDV